jgi:hypothetical protein
MPRGGARPGAGRKRKSDADVELDGNAGHRAKVFAHPSTPPPAPAPLMKCDAEDAPDDLNLEEKLVWAELAPYAFQARTLTPATGMAFKVLCRNIVIEKELRMGLQDRGRAAHQGIIGKIEGALQRFQLAPVGKAMATESEAAAKPANPLEKYLKHG